MFVQSVAPIWSRTWANDLAQGIVAATVPLAVPTVRLFTAYTKSPSPDSIAADFTEASFVGYAAASIAGTLVGPTNLSNGLGACIHGEADFIAGAGIVLPGQTVLGYWVDDGALAPKMVLSELFQTPVLFQLPFDTLSLDVIFPILFQAATGQ